MINWIKNNRIEFIIILVIIFLAAFFRFYKISEYMNFLGDEGRDALMIKRILVDMDFPLLGPPTSVGSMYLGPLYYYMMAVPMAIFWLNPTAASVQVAFIGVLTVGLIYFLTRVWFNKWSAMVAAVLYSISPVNIVLSRSSWNPNPAPFFALLAILGLYKLNKSGNYFWFVLTCISLAFIAQMHYLALILIPVSGILWLFEVVNRKVKKLPSKNLIVGTLLGVCCFLVLMSPLVIFDFKYDFVNYRALLSFFGDRQTTVNLNIFNTLGRIIPIYSHDLIGRFITQNNLYLTPLVSILVPCPLIYAIYLKMKKKTIPWSIFALGIWLIVGILGLSLYKQNLFDHYLGFLNPAPFILLGASLYLIQTQKIKFAKYLSLLFTILIMILVWVNLQNSPLKTSPNNQLERTQRLAQYVIKESQNKPFNFALLAKSNYDSAYQFYLDQYGHRPGQVPFNITDQLFVVCEDSECQPVGNPKYEIAGFGWAIQESVTEIAGVKVYKLIHNPAEKEYGKN